MRNLSRKMKCLVLGGNGYIGSHLVYILRQMNFFVSSCDIQDGSVLGHSDYISVNINDLSALARVDWNVDIIYLFSGITGTHGGFDEYTRYTHTNEIGLLNVLTAIRASGFSPKVVFPSTRLVYRGSEKPLREDDAKEPRTIYAINKLACENILEIYRNRFDINYSIFRICIPYGNLLGEDYSYGTLGFFLERAKSALPIILFGDGSLRRTFTHVEDICYSIIASSVDDKSDNTIFNIPGEAYSLLDVATLVGNRFRVGVQFNEWPDRDYRIESGHTVFDATRFLGRFSLETKHNLESWICNLNLIL